MCGCEVCVIIGYMQAPLNRYQLQHLNLLIEQSRSKGERMTHLGAYTNEKANSYANGIHPNNQHVHLNPRYALWQYNAIQ